MSKKSSPNKGLKKQYIEATRKIVGTLQTKCITNFSGRDGWNRGIFFPSSVNERTIAYYAAGHITWGEFCTKLNLEQITDKDVWFPVLLGGFLRYMAADEYTESSILSVVHNSVRNWMTENKRWFLPYLHDYRCMPIPGEIAKLLINPDYTWVGELEERDYVSLLFQLDRYVEIAEKGMMDE